jgi:hypothetical protein
LRDLGSGQTLTLVGRYLAAGAGDVVVRGKLGGRFFEQTLHVALPESESKNEALSSLWARGRIDALLRDPDGAVPDSVKAEVTTLAVNYRLMSPYTSFVAVDDSAVVNPTGESRSVRQALPMPEGVSDKGVVGGVVGGVEGGVAAGVPGGVPKTDPLSGQFVNLVRSDSIETLTVVTAGAGAQYGRAQGGFAAIATDMPVAGRFYQSVLALAPGVQDPAGDGNPNVNGARERDFKTSLGGISNVDPLTGTWVESRANDTRLLDSGFRVLADLADDGKLSKAEGKPALAALLAAQQPSGAIAGDVAVHAIATWALAEAAAAKPDDAAMAAAKTKAIAYLVGLAQPTGWPAWPGDAVDAETTRWARLVLSMIAPSAVGSIPVPAGEPTLNYTQLTASLAAARSGGKPPKVSGGSSFERLVRAIGRGHLKGIRVS